MEEFEIIFYETADGKCPVTDFIDSLPSKMREKIFKSIDILKIKGNSLREPYSKLLEDGIFELRCKVGTDITRTIVSEIDLAKARREDYIRREEENQHENFRRVQERTSET